MNCPRCEQLQSVGRAADVAWFWGLTLGVYGVLAFICLTAAVIGVTQQMPALWISTAAIWVVLTIALLIFIASS